MELWNYGLFPNDESRGNGNIYAINWSFSAYSTKFVDPALGFALVGIIGLRTQSRRCYNCGNCNELLAS